MVATTYEHDGGERLTREILFAALERVVWEHPALSIIGVERKSSVEGKHRIWEAQVRTVNLEDHVEFVEGEEGEEGGEGNADLDAAVAKAHNERFPMGSGKPLWRVVVVNGRYVLFVFDHINVDGRSGMAFHRSLLAALNSAENSGGVNATERRQDWVVPTSKQEPPVYWWHQVPDTVSKVRLTALYLWTKLLRILFPPSTRYFSDAVFDTSPLTLPAGPYEKRKTCVSPLRIPALRMSALLAACRDHGTSFTDLMHTAITATLAVDMYPQARLGVSSVAVSLRPYTTPPQSTDLMVNTASAYTDTSLLGKYRAANSAASTWFSSPAQTSTVESTKTISMDPDRMWALAIAFSKSFKSALARRIPLQYMLAMNLIGQDKEDMFEKCVSQIAPASRGSFLLSNGGAYDPGKDVQSPWNIIAMQCSGAANRVNGVPGFYMAGLKGEETTLTVTYEEGLISNKKVERMLEGIRQRLWTLSGM